MPMVTLRPNEPFHVGQDTGAERQKVHTYIPSDTLFSALVTTWAQLGRADEVIEQFRGQPPFTLTSAFPCLLARTDPPRALVRLLPLPLVRLPADELLPPKQRKHIRWVSWGVFEKLCAAQTLEGETSEANRVQAGTVWLLREEREAISRVWGREADSVIWWATEAVPRVAVDRVTSASNLFHTGRMALAEGVGLWFAIRGEDGAEVASRWLDLIGRALNVLADAGLGGLRSAGHGAFTWAWDDGPAPLLGESRSEAGYAVTLARYAPKDEIEVARSLQARAASYQLVTIAGWCQDEALHPWRRKRVRLVSEGSVIGRAEGPMGRLVDVRPTGAPQANFGGRGVYRYGYAFPVGVRPEALWEVEHD